MYFLKKEDLRLRNNSLFYSSIISLQVKTKDLKKIEKRDPSYTNFIPISIKFRKEIQSESYFPDSYETNKKPTRICGEPLSLFSIKRLGLFTKIIIKAFETFAFELWTVFQ